MLWLLVRSPQQYRFLWRNKKNVNTFQLKKSALFGAMSGSNCVFFQVGAIIIVSELFLCVLEIHITY